MNSTSFPSVVYEARPDWVKLYELTWELALRNLEYPPHEGWLPQMTCMPGMGKIWQWDSCFMTFFSRYGNGVIGPMNNLDNLYRLQREDGYISMAYFIASGKPGFGERINPPLYAWVEWEHYCFSGDAERLRRVYPVLTRYYHWLRRNRRHENGLYWFEDSGSSGMDNSPRSGYHARCQNGSDVCFVDLASQQAMAAGYLSKIAEVAGMAEDRAYFEQEYCELSALVNKYHWSERTGFYYDVFLRTSPESRHNFLPCKTIAAFWPMLAGIASAEQIRRLVEHLLNPAEFNTPHPVPTLSADDPNYDSTGGYWLGGVWAPSNYMIVRGLQKNNWRQVAREIVCRHLDMMSEVMNNPAYGSIWECYAPEYPMPATKYNGKCVRPNFVGWSGLGPVAMLIETILGIDFNAPENMICWHITERKRHGLENIRFAGGTFSLVSNGNNVPNSTEVTVTTDKTINLKFTLAGCPNFEDRRELSPGTHRIELKP